MRILTFIFILLSGAVVYAALQFPALTGRVVDDAHMLSASTLQSLDQTLAAHERETSNQVVIVTLASLQGTSIEDYGYQLGRTWQIGQKDKNNGALLIVAPNERKVRIEVGYGLEPILTDAVSSQIVQGIILPDFRNGNMEQGIIDGTQAILSVLSGKNITVNTQKNLPQNTYRNSTHRNDGPSLIIILLVFFIFGRNLFWLFFGGNSSRFGSSRMGGYGGGGFSGGGFGGGGFSGGGGGFGGGGASGSW